MNVLCTCEKTIKYTFLDQNGQGIPGIHGQLLDKQGVLYDQNITQSNGELLLKAPFNPKDSYVLRAEYKDITIYDDRLEKTLKKLRKEVTVGLYEFSVIITDSLGLPPGIEVTPILVTSKSNSTVQITPKENSQGSFT